MKKLAIHRAAKRAAEVLANMVRPALLPDELREYCREAYRLCRNLIEECGRQAMRDLVRKFPSTN